MSETGARSATAHNASGAPGRSPAGAGLTASRFLAAVLLFALLNVSVAWAGLLRVPAANFPELTWTAWTVRDFLQRERRPDVVFLGSSLVLVPIAGCDADYLGRRLDGSAHHVSAYFQDEFKRRYGRSLATFNFALPGEMPSDAYLIADFLLKGEKRPDVIVYGVGPRDFMDNLLPSPASTDPFRKLARFGDIGPLAGRVMPDFFDRLDFEMSRLSCFYGSKTDTTARLAALAAGWLDSVLAAPAAGGLFTTADRRRLLPAYRPYELSAGEAYFRPTTPAERTTLVDNLPEYRKRYKTVKWSTFVSQMEFLAGVLNSAREKGVKVVLVSMPITDANRSLIKDYAWDAYRQSVKALAHAKGASFIDLMGSGRFETGDFGDTVHLHSGGGRKMLDLLMDELAADSTVRAALRLPAPGGQSGARPVAGLSPGAL